LLPRSEAEPSEGGPPRGKAAERPRSEAEPSEGGPPRDEILCAEAEAIFVSARPEKFQHLLEERARFERERAEPDTEHPA
jgi:hypothetical protein